MWEHTVVMRDWNADKVQQELNNASSDGWELVSTNWNSDSYEMCLFFKRPKA